MIVFALFHRGLISLFRELSTIENKNKEYTISNTFVKKMNVKESKTGLDALVELA